MNNGAVRCGPLVCRPVSGIFSQTNLSNGYHNVATIPTGASNISITEQKNSANFLGKFNSKFVYFKKETKIKFYISFQSLNRIPESTS